jgi:hypothetical protein
MDERYVVWEHGENLFFRFKCKYYMKEFRGGGATRLKEHLAGKSENITWCTKFIVSNLSGRFTSGFIQNCIHMC